MLGDKSDRLRVTTKQWSMTGDDNEYSSIWSSKSEIDLGGNRQEGRVKELRGQVELEGMGIRTVM